MVARLCYLAEQSRLLYRPDTTGSYSGYVLLSAFTSKKLTSRYFSFWCNRGSAVGRRPSDADILDVRR